MVTWRYPKNIVTDILLCLLCVFVIILIFQFEPDTRSESVSADAAYDRIEFFYQNGWEVDSDSETQSVIELPSRADDVFNEYNKIQLEQGFDLTPYLGKSLKKYSYVLLENPYSEKYDPVYATLLIYEGHIVGADIYSPALDGFMQGVVVQ